MKRYLSYFAMLLFLNACSTQNAPGYSTYLERKNIPEPTLESFAHCHGYGCERYKDITLTAEQWQQILTPFKVKAQDAKTEREQIEESVGEFEKVVGPIAGTENDIRGTFRKTGMRQHDCVDESTNTTIYLLLLEQKGKIQFHDILGPSSRFLINGRPGWPHQTAVIREKASEKSYAVDSWFRNNGYPALTVPMEEWNKGWLPTDDLRPEVREK